MLFGALVLMVLVATWLTLRGKGASAPPAARPWTARHRWFWIAGGLGVVLLANAPLARILWPFSGLAPVTPSDAHTHAVVANWIAVHGLPHGWIDAYQAGFPIGVNYPPLAWLTGALLIRLGMTPQVAIQSMGVLGVLAVPLLNYLLLPRAGARLATALLAALFCCWLSTSNAFFGGWEGFFGYGLMSQILCMPAVVLVAGCVFDKRMHPAAGVVGAALVASSHPQVAVPFFAALGAAVIASWDRELVMRLLRAAVPATLIGAALYGPGLSSLKVPFGWPPIFRWMIIGFGSARLDWWLLEGEMLDQGRATLVLTSLWGASCVVLLLTLRRRASRAALAAAAVALALSISGPAIERLGSLGSTLLSFIQPLRAFPLVPLAAAACVAVAVEQSAPVALALAQRVLRAWSAHANTAIGALACVGFGLMAWQCMPTLSLWARHFREELVSLTPKRPCGERTPEGFEPPLIKHWLSELNHGRLWYDDSPQQPLNSCAVATGFELASALPIGNTNAAGAHVGVHTPAFHALDFYRPGACVRAEALGIRYVLLVSDGLHVDGWEQIESNDRVRLARRIGGTDTVGVGCVRSTWEGSNQSLHERLSHDLKNWEQVDKLLDPRNLIELRTTTGAVVQRPESDVACDASNAHVTESSHESGVYEAVVESPSPVDVVIRATAFPFWKLTVDGVESQIRKIVPGFFSTRLSAGTHHVVATVSLPTGYLADILIALLLSVPWGLSAGRVARLLGAGGTWRRMIAMRKAIRPRG